MLKYEEDLKEITKRGKVDVVEVVYFLKETGILKNKELYATFLLYVTLANHNGYLDAFEFMKKTQEDMEKEKI